VCGHVTFTYDDKPLPRPMYLLAEGARQGPVRVAETAPARAHRRPHESRRVRAQLSAGGHPTPRVALVRARAGAASRPAGRTAGQIVEARVACRCAGARPAERRPTRAPGPCPARRGAVGSDTVATAGRPAPRPAKMTPFSFSGETETET
jgi:hypothetical protein